MSGRALPNSRDRWGLWKFPLDRGAPACIGDTVQPFNCRFRVVPKGFIECVFLSNDWQTYLSMHHRLINTVSLLEGSNSWTAKSNCWGWAAPENKLMVFRVLRSIYDFGRDIYLSRSSHQRTHYYERIVGESYYIKALSKLRVPTIGVFITSLDWKNFTSWNYEKKNNAWNIKR